ncbi:hypothetical protein ABT390_13540 [Streptomyces aurantiacus]|uniref:Scaffolding protein n=1 Tax=Streptomyces aurantiacus JA 4570 TaxID=1286094 RepID=S4AFS8_9ACTN|nr:hypothetical protein [Streptomyces aurantiacus]EPH40342.1 hypothetical protein STRAU_6605 [Streptomyces aurantiacus JA 4570]
MSDTSTSSTPAGAPQGAPAAPSGPDPTPATPPTSAPDPATPPAPAEQGHNDSAATIARLESELAAARAEAGKSRVTAKQKAADDAVQQLTQDIGKALGLIKDDEQATPEQLTQQLTTAQEQARATAVELAVHRTAPSAGANPDALLDSRAFATAAATLDPADTDAVTAAIKAAVTANPRLAAEAQHTGAPRGGAEFTGPPSGGVTPAQFAAMDYAARAALFQSDPDTYRRLAGTP